MTALAWVVRRVLTILAGLSLAYVWAVVTVGEWLESLLDRMAARGGGRRHAENVLALARLMSEISEDCYAAGWMGGLEFALWAIVQGEAQPEYGEYVVLPEQVERLRYLSSRIGGWVAWSDEARGEIFVPMAQWERMYAPHGEARRP